jgi:L-lactate utilization protein LutC
MHGQVDERPKGQTWEAGKHECGDTKGCVWRRQRQGNRKGKSQVRSVLRRVTVEVRGKGEPTERQESEWSEINVWVMKQASWRVKVRKELTDEQEDERSGGHVGMTM